MKRNWFPLRSYFFAIKEQVSSASSWGELQVRFAKRFIAKRLQRSGSLVGGVTKILRVRQRSAPRISQERNGDNRDRN
ncbi:MAG: hypothetical protein DMF06_09595 [Verrucomicrobia bacterium]|nr:MAG: hypothetical protein DMF06_09595 [Verrucomicrobiota bacterium]